MSLITRTAKGSKLTIAEMDGNLTYLESNGFVDGVYSQTVIGTGAVLQMQPQAALNASIGVYENISPTGGSGTGLIVYVEIADVGRGLGATYTIVNGGNGYQVGDTVSIQNTDIGGTAGTTDRELFADDVDVTKTSTITVTEDEINLSTTTISVTGSIASDSSITTLGNISGSNVIATSTIQGSLLLGSALAISNQFGDTLVNFTNLPTSDPSLSGQLWNDSGSLKISAGV
jgi:hypothetical protein